MIAETSLPDGYVVAPNFRGYAAMGTGEYLLYACPRTNDLPPELVIKPATASEKVGRSVGDLQEHEPREIQADEIAVRIAFVSVAGLDALERQLRILREESFPESVRQMPEKLPFDSRDSLPIDWYDGWNAAIEAMRKAAP